MADPALVRVTVASPTRRVDLGLPGAVPVGELVNDLARGVGMLDPATVHGGYRLLTVTGRELSGSAGLAAQGIADGALLTVIAGADDETPPRYDDVVEAMADVVECEFGAWDADVGRRMARMAAVLLAVLGAVAVVVDRSFFASLTALGIAVCLVTGALATARVPRASGSAPAVAWAGAAYAAIAGFGFPPQAAGPELSLACAGAGAVIVGLVCLAGIREQRALVAPPVLVGAIFLATGLASGVLRVGTAVSLTTMLTIVVLTGSVVPTLALGAVGAMTDQLSSASHVPVDIHRLRANARRAQQIVVTSSVSTGLLLVLAAPFAVSLGVAGTALCLSNSLVVMLRTRRHRDGSQVLVGLVSGVSGLMSAAAAVIYFCPSWRTGMALCLAMAAIVVLTVTLRPSTRSVRGDRLADLVESAALLATVPVLLIAAGVLAAVRDGAGAW